MMNKTKLKAVAMTPTKATMGTGSMARTLTSYLVSPRSLAMVTKYVLESLEITSEMVNVA